MPTRRSPFLGLLLLFAVGCTHRGALRTDFYRPPPAAGPKLPLKIEVDGSGLGAYVQRVKFNPATKVELQLEPALTNAVMVALGSAIEQVSYGARGSGPREVDYRVAVVRTPGVFGVRGTFLGRSGDTVGELAFSFVDPETGRVVKRYVASDPETPKRSIALNFWSTYILGFVGAVGSEIYGIRTAPDPSHAVGRAIGCFFLGAGIFGGGSALLNAPLSGETVKASTQRVLTRLLNRLSAEIRADGSWLVGRITERTVGKAAEQRGNDAERRGDREAMLDAWREALENSTIGGQVDRRLRAKYVTALASGGGPIPPVPEVAREAMIRGQQSFRQVHNEAGYDVVVKEMELAVQKAPAWSTAYFNSALALEGAGRYKEAVRYLGFYLQLEPRAADAEAVRAKIRTLKSKPDAPAHPPTMPDASSHAPAAQPSIGY